jgi:hypothetical protein
MENFGKRLRVLIIKWKMFCHRENLAILDIMMPAAGPLIFHFQFSIFHLSAALNSNLQNPCKPEAVVVP